MIKSLARRTREKKMAAKLAGSTALSSGASNEGNSEYHSLLAALHNDMRELSDIESIYSRNPVKLEKSETYKAWVMGALEAGQQGQAAEDEIVSTQMIWAMDYGDYDYALNIAQHVIQYGLKLPERYKRTVACIVAEDIAESAMKPDADIDISILLRTEEITAGHDMPDQALAKLYKALGHAFADQSAKDDDENMVAGAKAAAVENALKYYKMALSKDTKSGVKRAIENMERDLKKFTQ